MKTLRVVSVVVSVSLVLACGPFKGLLSGGGGAEVTQSAEALLKAGDLPGAVAEYEKIAAENPESPHALQGVAYAKLLAGDYAASDKLLSDAAGKAAGDTKLLGEIELRRAIVALRAGRMDDVKAHGQASGLPAGAVMAGEVMIADSDNTEALKLMKSAAEAGGAVGDTAKKYAELLESTQDGDKDLAYVNAVWSVGGGEDRGGVLEAARDVLRLLPEDRADRSEMLLVWAGRALTVAQPAMARDMLDAISTPPEGQAWRIRATEAMIAIAEGRNDEGLATFAALAEAGAPSDGLSDALATAAALTKDAEVAQKLAGSVESVAAARGLMEAGASEAAKQAAPDASSYSKVLGGS
jgi:hypothetical protein